MTEQEWLESVQPGQMIWHSKASDRKKALLGAACLRRIEQFFPGPLTKNGMEFLEGFADGQGAADEWEKLRLEALEEGREYPNPSGNQLPHTFAGVAMYYSDDVEMLMHNCAEATAWANAGTPEGVSSPEEQAQCRLIKEVIVNPFRPITIDPRWLTSTVVDLANNIYTERAFDRMALLADALMDAGCDNEEIIEHCRGESPHVRGCWVVDLLLDKK